MAAHMTSSRVDPNRSGLVVYVVVMDDFTVRVTVTIVIVRADGQAAEAATGRQDKNDRKGHDAKLDLGHVRSPLMVE